MIFSDGGYMVIYWCDKMSPFQVRKQKAVVKLQFFLGLELAVICFLS